MDQSCVTPDEQARKSHSRALRHLQKIGQNTIAEKISVSPTTVSRFVADDLERACLILAHAGLKVVPTDRIAIKTHIFESMATLIYEVLDDRDTVRKLVLED